MTRVVRFRGFSTYSPVDFSQYLSSSSKRRQPSPIRKLQPLLSLPGMISLGGGLPNPQLFPFTGLHFTLSTGNDKNIELTKQELDECLQYSATPGIPSLLTSLQQLQKREHILADDPRSDNAWQISVTTGSQDALNKAFSMLIQEGDTVFVENPTYSGALACLRPIGCHLIGLQTDKDGLIPSSLETALEEWNISPASTCASASTFTSALSTDSHSVLSSRSSSSSLRRRPRVLYTIVTGQNPSGATLSADRKRKIYELACKHDLIILEDDPYRYLEYGSAAAPQEDAKFSRPVNHSLFSMDRQGRVLRFDSLSKVLSSGLRLGFVTGPASFVRQLDLDSQASTLHSSGVSQMLASKLLQKWGAEGWNRHCDTVALFYARRRDVFISLCEKYLQGLATWDAPSAGMFVWLRLNNTLDSQKLIEEKALEAKIILLHGAAFTPNGEVSNFVRASFSTASDSQMELGLQRFAKLLESDKST